MVGQFFFVSAGAKNVPKCAKMGLQGAAWVKSRCLALFFGYLCSFILVSIGGSASGFFSSHPNFLLCQLDARDVGQRPGATDQPILYLLLFCVSMCIGGEWCALMYQRETHTGAIIWQGGPYTSSSAS